MYQFMKLGLAGLLLFSPWIYGFGSAPAAAPDAWICGTLIGFSSLWGLALYRGWEEWVGLPVGLWLLLSPWLLGFHHAVLAAMRVDVTIGMAVVVIALAHLWLTRQPPRVTA